MDFRKSTGLGKGRTSRHWRRSHHDVLAPEKIRERDQLLALNAGFMARLRYKFRESEFA